jgi:hypothetical protein
MHYGKAKRPGMESRSFPDPCLFKNSGANYRETEKTSKAGIWKPSSGNWWLLVFTRLTGIPMPGENLSISRYGINAWLRMLKHCRARRACNIGGWFQCNANWAGCIQTSKVNQRRSLPKGDPGCLCPHSETGLDRCNREAIPCRACIHFWVLSP